MVKKTGLGRGLSALIPKSVDINDDRDHYEELSVNLLDPNPEQPRQHFDAEQLQELSDSIKHNGVIQPIIVTPSESRFIVIAGERRWRATALAGFQKIPAIVRRIDKEQMLSLALLENIQRQELNPIEEALAYNKLLQSKNITQETLAGELGKSRVSISNTIRLLKLPSAIRDMIQDGKLTFGHARCLVTVDDEAFLEKLAQACVRQQWSVRELERRIQQSRKQKESPKPQRKQVLNEVEQTISKALGSKVSVVGDGKKGKIAITYRTAQEFDKLMKFFSVS